MTASEKALRDLARTTKRIADATERRDQQITELVEGGVSLRKIGAAAGVSHEQVRLIAGR